MTNAVRDENRVTAALGVSSTDSTATLPFKIDSATGRLLVGVAGVAGDVVGPASSTDNAVARFDTITGKLLQNSVVLIGDTGAITGALSLNLSGLTASEIVITDGSKNLASAAVATYPSLTELTYVKGVTSAIQTQITAKMTNPMTTGGDVIYGGASGVPTRLANGSAGQVLQSNGTTLAPSWVAAGAGDMVLASAQTVTGAKTFNATTLLLRNVAGTFNGLFTNTNTADRIYTLQNRAGTLADDTDLALKANLASPTFTGTVVLPSGQALIAPALGTPASGVMTNVTGLPAAAILPGTLAVGTYLLAENASIGLDPAGSADGKYTGITVTGTAGATLAFGDLVYLAVATSKWVLTDADAAATAGGVMVGMCVLAADDTQSTTILLQGIIRADAKFPALTIGAVVYVGETAGAIQVAIPTGADNVIRVVGFAMTADEIYFNPSQDHQTTVA